MGEAQQTAWKVLREGKLGTVRLIYAEINHGRIESWHPNPGPFYEVGVLWDVGVYPLTLITTFFGPVRKVHAYGRVIYPDRVNMAGEPFHITTPDCTFSALEMECGALVRLTANFYAKNSKQGGSLEMHGDEGMLYIGNFQSFQTSVEYAQYGDEFTPVEYVKEPFEGIEFGRGVDDMATAMLNGVPQRATGAQAAHVVEVLEAISKSMETREQIEVKSSFPQPTPMDWSK